MSVRISKTWNADGVAMAQTQIVLGESRRMWVVNHRADKTGVASVFAPDAMYGGVIVSRHFTIPCELLNLEVTS